MEINNLKSIRKITVFFIICLALSGITAFPLVTEINFLEQHKDIFPNLLQDWILQIKTAIEQTDSVVLYGTDWLAFAHLIIASFFIGVYKDPVKNKFIVQVGIAACFAVFPLAFIFGPIRGIPLFHQLIDCCFGIVGLIPLLIIYRKIKILESGFSTTRLTTKQETSN
ncbi:MAG: hypothetical protein Q8M29_08640 [Bacteroidota bacterium]|nr:hypothetical protein [Bacteroidota bacterium]